MEPHTDDHSLPSLWGGGEIWKGKSEKTLGLR